jgi:hypothetical protein
MSQPHARDPFDELDALMREAMDLTSSPGSALGEPAQVPLRAAWPDPFADQGGKVVSFTARMSEAALRAFGRRQH